MTNSLSYGTPLYYRHSGQFSAFGLSTAVIGGLIVAVFLALVHAYVDLYCPLIYFNLIATVFFGLGVGGAAGYLLRRGHVRSTQISFSLGLAVALLALYASWVFWVYALIQKSTGRAAPFNPLDLAFRPDRLWGVILAINDVGTWSVGHLGSSTGQVRETVHGPWLWGVWLIEAGLVLGLSMSVTRRFGSAVPYCETCQRWCPAGKRLFSTPPGDPAMMKDRLEAKDFSYLISLGPEKKPLPSSWFEAYLHSCENCKSLHALTVNFVQLQADRKGKQQKKERAVVDKLLLTTKELQTLQSLKDQYLARQAQPQTAPPETVSPQGADGDAPENSTEEVADRSGMAP